MYAKDREFYQSIWSSRSHWCESCDKKLPNEPKTWMFDHLLEKSKYPDLRHEPDNIILVCFECHEKKTNGFPTAKHLEHINRMKSFITNNLTENDNRTR